VAVVFAGERLLHGLIDYVPVIGVDAAKKHLVIHLRALRQPKLLTEPGSPNEVSGAGIEFEDAKFGSH
jgi:hypothetical protein